MWSVNLCWEKCMRTLKSWYKSRGLCAQCPKFFNIDFLKYVNGKTTHYEMKNDAKKRKPVCMAVDPEWTWNLDLRVCKEEWAWQTLMLECWTFPRKAYLISVCLLGNLCPDSLCEWHPTPVLLPGKIPWTEEPSGLQSMGSLRVRHDWATSVSLFTFMHWRRKWQSTPVFLPGESQGRGSWWAAVYGDAQSWTRLTRLSSSSSLC